MGNRWVLLAAALVAASLVGTGCKKKIPAPVPLGEAAAAFGTEHKTIDAFIVGKWCPTGGMDADTAAKFDVDPGSDVDVSQYWEFMPDKTFYYTKTGSVDKVHGKWEVFGEAIGLSYLKWNDEDIMAARMRFQKEAETGSSAAIAKEIALDWTFNTLFNMNYLVVSEDKTGVTFTDSSATANPFSGIADTPLARVK